MSKKIKEKNEKKTQKGKSSISKPKNKTALKGVKEKLKLTKKDLKNQVSVLTNEVKSIGKKTSAPTRKMIKKLEKKYKKKILKLQQKFDTKLAFLQDKVVAKLPDEITEKLHIKTKYEDNISSNTATKTLDKVKRLTPKSKESSISDIKGIGPILQKKLQEAGVTKVDELANPSEAQTLALKQFEKARGFESWQIQAKELLNE